jgi:hypothetical protein
MSISLRGVRRFSWEVLCPPFDSLICKQSTNKPSHEAAAVALTCPTHHRGCRLSAVRAWEERRSRGRTAIAHVPRRWHGPAAAQQTSSFAPITCNAPTPAPLQHSATHPSQHNWPERGWKAVRRGRVTNTHLRACDVRRQVGIEEVFEVGPPPHARALANVPVRRYTTHRGQLVH